MGIRSDKTISVTASGRFDIEDLIKELRDAYPAGRSDQYKLEAYISVYKAKASDQRDSDSVTFHITPKPKSIRGTGTSADMQWPERMKAVYVVRCNMCKTNEDFDNKDQADNAAQSHRIMFEHVVFQSVKYIKDGK